MAYQHIRERIEQVYKQVEFRKDIKEMKKYFQENSEVPFSRYIWETVIKRFKDERNKEKINGN